MVSVAESNTGVNVRLTLSVRVVHLLCEPQNGLHSQFSAKIPVERSGNATLNTTTTRDTLKTRTETFLQR